MQVLPRISVALCVYNGARYLPRQLDSLLAQEGVDLEIVVVDDASTDDSLALLQACAARDARVRVHAHERNAGHLRSFVECMALCSSELIAPCDQDDVWHPRKLATLAQAIGDRDMAYCDSQYIDGDGKPLGRRISDDLGIMHAGHGALPYAFQNTASGHAMLVRRSVFDAALPFPALLYHDWWLAMCAAAGKGVAYVHEPLVQFRRHRKAASPLGKEANARLAAECERLRTAGQCSRNRKWLEQVLYVTRALADTSWPCARQAREWHLALLAAMDGDYGNLKHLTWRDRACLPPWDGPQWMRAARGYARFRRKVRRAVGEPTITTPLFSA